MSPGYFVSNDNTKCHDPLGHAWKERRSSGLSMTNGAQRIDGNRPKCFFKASKARESPTMRTPSPLNPPRCFQHDAKDFGRSCPSLRCSTPACYNLACVGDTKAQ